MNLQVFTNNDYELRQVHVAGEVHYVARDWAAYLGLSKPEVRRKTRQLDDDETTVIDFQSGSRGTQKTTVVTLPGMMSLILSCPQARRHGTPAWTFRRWVTHDVLPQILKTGEYKIAELKEELAVKDEELAVKDLEFAASERELQFVEHNRLYKVAFRIPSVHARPEWFRFVKSRARRFLRPQLIWRDRVPYIRLGHIDQVTALLS